MGLYLQPKISRLFMILEVAVLNVIPEKTTEFEAGFETAQQIISSAKGYIRHLLQQCLEVSNRYILLVLVRHF
jgi:heme-degrading monooxygenase HmoA